MKNLLRPEMIHSLYNSSSVLHVFCFDLSFHYLYHLIKLARSSFPPACPCDAHTVELCSLACVAVHVRPGVTWSIFM